MQCRNQELNLLDHDHSDSRQRVLFHTHAQFSSQPLTDRLLIFLDRKYLEWRGDLQI